MKHLLLCLCLLCPTTALAEASFPALYDVAGVAANDVLNLRAEPGAASPIVGSLPPTLTGVEVVELSADGKWARINQSEASGWAALRFLMAQDRPAWYEMQQDLQCSGTEPFWTLYIEPKAATAHINTPDEEGPELDVLAQWPGTPWRQAIAVQLASEDGGGFATIRAESCSDGMSEGVYGLTVDLFLHGLGDTSQRGLRGCCTLVP